MNSPAIRPFREEGEGAPTSHEQDVGSTKRLEAVLAPPPLRASPDALLLVVLGAVGLGGGVSAWLSKGGLGPAVAVPWAVGAVLGALGLGLVRWRKRRGDGLLTLDPRFVTLTRGDDEVRFLLERLNAVIQTRGSDSGGRGSRPSASGSPRWRCSVTSSTSGTRRGSTSTWSAACTTPRPTSSWRSCSRASC